MTFPIGLKLLALGVLLTLSGCESGTEPLNSRNIVGSHKLVLVDGYNPPFDIWQSGELTLRADSSYTMVVNGATYDAGTWTVKGNELLVTSTREAVWIGFIQPHSILLPRDPVHYNDFVFDQ